MRRHSIRKQIIFLSGFSQEDDEWDGTEDVMYDVLCEVGSRQCYVSIDPWSRSAGDLAARVLNMKTEQVMIAGFSLGAGQGAVSLCEALNGVADVTHMVLCDPIPFNQSLVWSFFRRRYEVTLPKNAGRVWTLRQSREAPIGARIVRSSDNTKIISDRDLTSEGLDYGHREMDDSEEFRQVALTVAREFYEAP